MTPVVPSCPLGSSLRAERPSRALEESSEEEDAIEGSDDDEGDGLDLDCMY